MISAPIEEERLKHSVSRINHSWAAAMSRRLELHVERSNHLALPDVGDRLPGADRAEAATTFTSSCCGTGRR